MSKLSRNISHHCGQASKRKHRFTYLGVLNLPDQWLVWLNFKLSDQCRIWSSIAFRVCSLYEMYNKWKAYFAVNGIIFNFTLNCLNVYRTSLNFCRDWSELLKSKKNLFWPQEVSLVHKQRFEIGMWWTPMYLQKDVQCLILIIFGELSLRLTELKV